MTTTKTVSEVAAARAKQAHGGVPHGDNDPAASAELEGRVQALDAQFGRVQPSEGAMSERTYQLPEPGPERCSRAVDQWTSVTCDVRCPRGPHDHYPTGGPKPTSTSGPSTEGADREAVPATLPENRPPTPSWRQMLRRNARSFP